MMRSTNCSHLLLLILFSCVQCFWAYEVANVTFKVTSKGFEASIPHEDGITFFGFRGKLNEPMENLGDHTLFRDITLRSGKRWVYRNTKLKPKSGDTIYYWTYVIKKGKGYFGDSLDYTFTENSDEAKTTKTPLVNTPAPEPKEECRDVQRVNGNEIIYYKVCAIDELTNESRNDCKKVERKIDGELKYYSVCVISRAFYG